MSSTSPPNLQLPPAQPSAPDGALGTQRGSETADRLNVYQMILGTLGPVFLRRDSWSTGFAEVLSTDPSPGVWRLEQAPYFKNPVVFALLKYGAGSPYVISAISGPGTFGYFQVLKAPAWWRRGLNYPVLGYHKGRKLELSEAGFRVL